MIYRPGSVKNNSRSVLITGGTGLIGQAMIPVLEAAGHSISILTRRPGKYPVQSGSPQLFASLADIPIDYPVDAVINLAGARIIGHRWTDRRKQVLRSSRIDLTKELVEWMARRPTPPDALISGSAAGYYGNRHSDILDENEPFGGDFGARLCRDWEAEAMSATSLGTRVVAIRTGLVLSGQGGMLPPMLRSFQWGLGAKIGDGKQWMSWIHIDDQVAAMVHLLTSRNSSGAYNLSAPDPVTNTDFCRGLANVLRRPCMFTAPAPILRLALGEAAELLLSGQRLKPAKLQNERFRFRYPTLQDALSSITHG